MASKIISRTQQIRNEIKQLRAIFPMFKESGESAFDLRTSIELKINHELNTSLYSRSVEVLPVGAMDQFASGVITFLVGRNVEPARWLRLGERIYDVELKLGEAREGATAAGQLINKTDFQHVTKDMLLERLRSYRGDLLQSRPPRDTPLRERREDLPPIPEEVASFPRTVVCHEITLKDEIAAFEPPLVKLQVHCGAKFNVRSFTEELAKDLGTVAHVTRLHRRLQAPFSDAEALPSYAFSWAAARDLDARNFDRVHAYIKSLRQENRGTRRQLFEGVATFR